MSPRINFFSLPRELRDAIYRYYVTEDDGYHYDYKSGKLRTVSGKCIDLALMYTCTFVAAEMRHLPLGLNVLTFRTVCPESERLKAGRFHLFLEQLDLLRLGVLAEVRSGSLQHFFTPDICSKVSIKYPEFLAFLNGLQEQLPIGSACPLILSGRQGWGETRSRFRSFMDYTLSLFSEHSNFFESLNVVFHETRLGMPGKNNGIFCYLGFSSKAAFSPSAMLLNKWHPWMIPSEEELSKIDSILGTPFCGDDCACKGKFWEQIRWRFSAAAVALRFFGSMSPYPLSTIRTVILNEDKQSIADPESHMVGLVPFCIQNPYMHIERRVNMWSNLLLNCGTTEAHGKIVGLLQCVEFRRNGGRQGVYLSLCYREFAHSCARWITEAVSLQACNMPLGSFSMVLEGVSDPEQNAVLFSFLKDAAAWQVAQTQWFNNRAPDLSPFLKRSCPLYFSEAFPQAIDDIIDGNSLIRCTFPTGDRHDSQSVIHRNRHVAPRLNLQYIWHNEWTRHCVSKIIPPSHPFPPSMADLAFEEIMSIDPECAALNTYAPL